MWFGLVCPGVRAADRGRYAHSPFLVGALPSDSARRHEPGGGGGGRFERGRFCTGHVQRPTRSFPLTTLNTHHCRGGYAHKAKTADVDSNLAFGLF